MRYRNNNHPNYKKYLNNLNFSRKKFMFLNFAPGIPYFSNRVKTVYEVSFPLEL